MAGVNTVDIVLWGATGFTGRLAAAYLSRQDSAFASTTIAPGAPRANLTFALAGRSRTKLEALHEEMGCADSVPILVADAADKAAVDAVVMRARVVCSLAGPFVLYGSSIIESCARLGTHYVDITGEVAWVRNMMDQHDQAAKKTGALIVPMCGFDSIPSDLGTLFAIQECRKGGDDAIRRVCCVQTVSSPYASGGAIASFIQMDKTPVALCSGTDVDDIFLLGGEPTSGRRKEDEFPTCAAFFGPPFDTWVGPFSMAPINTRVVRRSHSLLAYGHDFNYAEYAAAPSEEAALLLVKALRGAPVEKREQMVVQGRLPAPGEGPTPQQRQGQTFTTALRCEAACGRVVVATVSGGEHAYEETAKMVVESAICLAEMAQQRHRSGGFSTPAAAMGGVLIEKLQAAGIAFEIVSSEGLEAKL